MAISYNAARDNSRLTDFEGVREHVIVNAVRNVPAISKMRKAGKNTSLSFFT